MSRFLFLKIWWVISWVSLLRLVHTEDMWLIRSQGKQIMEVSARLNNAPMSAQKARLVGDQIRGLPVEKALNLLKFSSKKAATIIKKILDSAIANAEHNESADIDELIVKTVFVNEGVTLKRVRARAKGRANHILKRTCHITVKVAEYE